jgi:RimJ/RimL family protein N-acetyltransferase
MPRASATLRDGSRIEMRPIRPSDKERLATGFERLSPEARYRRFFAPLTRLSSTDLRYLTEVDHSDHEAIVALDPRDGEIVGVARYVRTDQPDAAEVAVTVLDGWHGRGVATAVLERLVARAREEGIERFLALVLSDNADAIELFRHLGAGEPTPEQSRSGNVELVIELPEQDRVPGTTLGRALRHAARGEIVMNPWRLLKRGLHDLGQGWPHLPHRGESSEGDNRPEG